MKRLFICILCMNLLWPLSLVWAITHTPKSVSYPTYYNDEYFYTSRELDTWIGFPTCGYDFKNLEGIIIRHAEMPC